MRLVGWKTPLRLAGHSSWTTPLPWRPRIAIPGWSELKLNADELIISHIDYWDCSRLDVLKQHFVS
jgi:hypothetical protein